MQIGILEPDNFSDNALLDLRRIGEVSLFSRDLDEFLLDKEILFVRLRYHIGGDFLNKAPKLRFICTPTTGLNHIDMTEAEKRSINIISLKGEAEFLSTIRATPEHIFGLTLALLRHYKDCFLDKNNSKWDRDKYGGYEIYKNKVGIIGFGRIGKILASYYKSFGAEVFFYDTNKAEKSNDLAIRMESINELIINTNIVVLCASYSIENEKFFSKRYIDLLRNKYFINASRGELVDEDYLIEKIEEGFFKGLALDVISGETLDTNHLMRIIQLVGSRNIIVTPHIGGATFESMHRTEEFIVGKLINRLNMDI